MADPGQSEGGGMAAFGRHLVQERELRGLSREDVVRATRLPAAAIEAIETGDAERTPHRAYVVVYLRGYAAAVGLDPDEVVLRFEEAIGPAHARPAPPSNRAAIVGALLLVGALAVGALAFWSFRRR